MSSLLFMLPLFRALSLNDLVACARRGFEGAE